MEQITYSAFTGQRLIASGELSDMLKAVKNHIGNDVSISLVIFNDDTGEQVDFDLRGTEEEVLARVNPPKVKAGPGRPSLGVVCCEVSLLPRQWEWLEAQQKNISATIRRLVDDAIRNEPASSRARRAIEAVDRELWVVAGNLPCCEEASRALYAKDFERFRSLIKDWPTDIANHLSALVRRAE
jgi:uncharacterized protein